MPSEIRVCKAPGCPWMVLDPTPLSERLSGMIPEGFRVSIAGCANACSEPQIADFGVIARAIPQTVGSKCTACMECVSSCQEGAVQVIGGPMIDYMECVGCTDCVRACPSGSITAERRGWSVLIGGKLGRHPRFAQELMHLAAEDEVVAALEASLALYAEACESEPFSAFVERLGIQTFMRAAEEKMRPRFHVRPPRA
ncbi:MAG: 4Fe-4S binding protein [Armatimonadota bacterium]